MSQATAAVKKDSQAEHHEELSFLYKYILPFLFDQLPLELFLMLQHQQYQMSLLMTLLNELIEMFLSIIYKSV